MSRPEGRAVARVRGLGAPALLLTAGFGALYLATYAGQLGSPDEKSRFALAVALARRGLGALAHSGGVSKYPPLQSLLAAPLVRLGLALDGGAAGPWAHWLGLSVSLLSCTALVPLFLVVARRLTPSPLAATVATAVFGITNPVWPYSKRFFSEPLTAALAFGAFAGAFLYARGGRRGPLVAGLVCLALLPLNNYVAPVAVGLALAVLFLLSGRCRALRGLAVALVAGAVLTAASLLVREGSVLRTGYGGEGFWFHFLQGLHGLLLGWGRSIFVYAPMLLLAAFGFHRLWRRDRPTAAALATVLGVTLVVIANWWCWWGGICWGPRLMLPALPLASLAAVPLFERPGRGVKLGVALVTVAGLYVQAMGFSFKSDFDIYFWRKSHADEVRSWFELTRSAVWRMPRHFVDQPWDLSSAFVHLVQRGPSVVWVDGRPVRAIRLTNEGDEIVSPWTVSDVFAVLRDGDHTRRVPAAALGARFRAFDGARGTAALDGNPATRWTSRTKRLRGMWVELELPTVRRDVLRLEVAHLPDPRGFPNGLSAKVQGPDGRWTKVPADARTPALAFSPLLFLFAGGGVALVLGGLAATRRRGRG